MRKQEEYEQEKASHQLLHLGAELLKLQLARPVAVQDLAIARSYEAIPAEPRWPASPSPTPKAPTRRCPGPGRFAPSFPTVLEAMRAKARLEEDVEAGDRVLDPDRCKLNDLQDGRFLCIFLFDACERGGTLKRMLRRAVRSSSST